MKRIAIFLSLGLLVAFGLLITLAPVPRAGAQTSAPAISEAEAHAIGVDAYVYLYSLVSMEISRKQFTNVEPGKEFRTSIIGARRES